jgi:hypothetical protein
VCRVAVRANKSLRRLFRRRFRSARGGRAAVLALGFAVICGALCFSTSEQAWSADFVWDGEPPTGGAWSAGENWVGGVAPSGVVGTLAFPELNPECTIASGPTCYENVNDIAGLTVGAITIDTDDSYGAELGVLADLEGRGGESISLGAGGITGTGGPDGGGAFLDFPIALTAPQAWNFGGGHGEVYFGGDITGAAAALGITLAEEQAIDFNGADNEVGPVTITGGNESATGSEAARNGTVVLGYIDPVDDFGGGINSADQNAVSIVDARLTAYKATVGPLTVDGGNLVIGSSVGDYAPLTVAGALDFEGASTLDMFVDRGGGIGGVDYSQIIAGGGVELAGTTLTLHSGTECSSVRPGDVATLISAEGPISGSFESLPDGAVIPLECGPHEYARIHYAPHSVTVTIEEELSQALPRPAAIPTPAFGSLPTVPALDAPGLSPQAGVRVVVAAESGTVTIRVGRTGRFVPLSGAAAIPNGSELDTTHGVVSLTVGTGSAGQTASAEVHGGRFVLAQRRVAPFTSRLELSAPLSGCARGQASRKARSPASEARRRVGTKMRRLWVSERGGDWGTDGRYVSTTVEGTRWLTIDECNSSKVIVTSGRVRVKDLIRHVTRVVAAGQSYVTDAPGGSG